jgi:hypothetical protein
LIRRTIQPSSSTQSLSRVVEQEPLSAAAASPRERTRTGREGTAGAGSAAIVCTAALGAGNIGSAGEIARNEPARVTAAITMRRRGDGATDIFALRNGFHGVGGRGGEHLPKEGDTLWIGLKGVGGQTGHSGLPEERGPASGAPEAERNATEQAGHETPGIRFQR